MNTKPNLMRAGMKDIERLANDIRICVPSDKISDYAAEHIIHGLIEIGWIHKDQSINHVKICNDCNGSKYDFDCIPCKTCSGLGLVPLKEPNEN